MRIEDESIDTLALSIRPYQCLQRAGILTIGELMAMPIDDFLKIRGIGRKSAEEVIAKLMELSLECEITRNRQAIYGGGRQNERAVG